MAYSFCKKMKRHYALFLILWASGFWFSLKAADELDPNNYRSIHWSYFDGKKYASGVSHEVFEKMTKWNFESKKAPPVSPQMAYNLAKERLDKIKMRKGLGWDLEQVGLTPVGSQEEGKWIWKVSSRKPKLEKHRLATGHMVEGLYRITAHQLPSPNDAHIL